MNRKKVYLLVVSLSLSILIIDNVLCQETELLKGQNMNEVVVGKYDSNKVINILPGNLITIRLEENPSTGYQWEIELSDNQVVSVQKSKFIAGQQETLGGSGTRFFTLKAIKPGSLDISLIHKKPWKKNDSVIEKFSFTIKVATK